MHEKDEEFSGLMVLAFYEKFQFVLSREYPAKFYYILPDTAVLGIFLHFGSHGGVFVSWKLEFAWNRNLTFL